MDDVLIYIISGIISLIVVYFQSVNSRKYREIERLKTVTYKNKEDIATMVVSDKATKDAFTVYKTTMEGKNKEFMFLLGEIKSDLRNLVKVTGDLRIEVERIKKV